MRYKEAKAVMMEKWKEVIRYVQRHAVPECVKEGCGIIIDETNDTIGLHGTYHLDELHFNEALKKFELIRAEFKKRLLSRSMDDIALDYAEDALQALLSDL